MMRGASDFPVCIEKKPFRPDSRSSRSLSVCWRRGSVAVVGWSVVSVTSLSLGGLLAEEAGRAEDEDRDQKPEHDRARPVAAGREPLEPFVELLDEADDDAAED